MNTLENMTKGLSHNSKNSYRLICYDRGKRVYVSADNYSILPIARAEQIARVGLGENLAVHLVDEDGIMSTEKSDCDFNVSLRYPRFIPISD